MGNRENLLPVFLLGKFVKDLFGGILIIRKKLEKYERVRETSLEKFYRIRREAERDKICVCHDTRSALLYEKS